MLTGLITGVGRFELRDVAEPRVVPGGVVVDIALCGICGSDVIAYRDGQVYPPTLCGHEWVGTVSAVASDVTGLAEGDRVVCSAPPPCGTRCPACRQGRYRSCANVAGALLGRDGFSPESGGFARRQTVDARRLVRVPDELSMIQAAMVEPATVATHAVRRCGVRAGDRVGVIGAGPIGLFALQGLRAAGTGSIAVIDPDPARRELALELGADVTWEPGSDAKHGVAELTGELGLDISFDCAGVPATIQDAARLARQGGTVMLVGVAAGHATINPATWILKELSVRTSLGFDKSDTAAVIDLLATRRIRVEPLHSDTVGLDHAGAALDGLATGSGAVKVLVDPNL